MTSGLVERTVGFCRALRERGLLVTTTHAFEAVRALRCVGVDRRDQAYWALRCVLAARPEDFDTFDELFNQLFAPPQPQRVTAANSGSKSKKKQPPDAGAPSPSFTSWGKGEVQGEEPEEVPAASDQEVVATKDFSSFGSEELEEVERIAARIARRLAARPSRRWKPGHAGSRVDLRRTLRRATAGELLELKFRRRKPRKTRIVAICDVSGSMDLYSRLLLQFLYALQGSAARVESFVFATELRRVTEVLRAPDYKEALRELSAEAHGFSGGTRIGACLAAFNEGFSRLVDSRTVVVVLSDGWDTGDPAVLSEAMSALRRRSRRLVWLNPLLGSPGYEPLTRGMVAAIPHTDHLLAGNSLASLEQLAAIFEDM